MGYITGTDRNQMVLFPNNIDEYISEDSAVRVIDAYVDRLELGKLSFAKS